ncbi:TlpA family protein disulfide reductase [Flavobacterium sp. ZB4P13]|uniref:TlpA family protein disulfide reductase n=1 Tax=Flavobacterium sp. ZB4P13 TaxID=3401728 RepID=UPI003AAECAA7
MKKTTFSALFLLIFVNLWSQNNVEKSALLNANKMTSFYNSKDFLNYVNYVFPQDYGNDIAKKGELADLYKKYKNNETDKIEIIKVLKTSTVNGQYQALFLERNNNQDGYIFGISNDKGKNWFFTNAYSNQVQFDQIIKKIPTIDTVFSKFIDPKFGKRISHEIGKPITPFSFTDINGNLLSSDSLKGKVIVLNFWGTRCPPCIAEIPELNNLVEKMKGKEIVFIAPVIDATKEILTNSFLPKHPFKYQIVLVNQDDYNITSFPTNLVIDQNLKVVEKLIGASPENLKKIEQKINEIIK